MPPDGRDFTIVFDYRATKDGRIWSHRLRRFMTPYVDDEGYSYVYVGKRNRRLARLLLFVFAGPPEPGQVVRHLDGNPRNNHIDNLDWGTHAENWQDKRDHGRATTRERHGRAKLNEEAVAAIRAATPAYGYAKALADRYGVSASLIRKVRSGEIWNAA